MSREIRVGGHQKLEICFYFCEFESLQRRIVLQHWNVFARLCFEGHMRVTRGGARIYPTGFPKSNRGGIRSRIDPGMRREDMTRVSDRTRHRRTAIEATLPRSNAADAFEIREKNSGCAFA